MLQIISNRCLGRKTIWGAFVPRTFRAPLMNTLPQIPRQTVYGRSLPSVLCLTAEGGIGRALLPLSVHCRLGSLPLARAWQRRGPPACVSPDGPGTPVIPDVESGPHSRGGLDQERKMANAPGLLMPALCRQRAPSLPAGVLCGWGPAGRGLRYWVWVQKVPYCLGGMVRAVERLKLRLRWGAIGEVWSVFRSRVLPGEQNSEGSEVKPDLFRPTCTLFPEWLSPLLG